MIVSRGTLVSQLLSNTYMEYVKTKIRDVIDFPQKGVIFRDLTTAFKDPKAIHILGWNLSQIYRDKGVTKVVGIESRGFICGSILAFELGAGFVPARKPGKLPSKVISTSYDKEYGKDTIEIHSDAITPDDVVVIHDDVLATGGTMAAVYELVRRFNPRKIYINAIVELSDLGGRAKLPAEAETTALITY
ncbi:adenine phosphoribosyltransferase [Paramuribaculum intestinale]|uniref:adenine phosphoribosyltransferase n=2 Tax=Paramuribaculum intestinale TaxID=2094151 RepID=UPI003A5C7E30